MDPRSEFQHHTKLYSKYSTLLVSSINLIPVSLDFFLLTPHMKMEQTEYSETSAHKIQRPGNNPKERIQ